MIDITELVVSIVIIILSLISLYLVPYLRERYKKEELINILTWVDIAVNAAEQLTKSGVIDPNDRKDYVKYVLESKGIKLNLNELDDIIEAFVLQLPETLLGEIENTNE